MKVFNPNEITMLVRIAFGGAIVYSAVSLWRKIRPRTGEGSRDLDQLWERYERGEILTLVAEGLTNAQIADTLSLSEFTIKQHLRHTYKILGVSNRTQAANLFRKAG